MTNKSTATPASRKPADFSHSRPPPTTTINGPPPGHQPHSHTTTCLPSHNRVSEYRPVRHTGRPTESHEVHHSRRHHASRRRVRRVRQRLPAGSQSSRRARTCRSCHCGAQRAATRRGHCFRRRCRQGGHACRQQRRRREEEEGMGRRRIRMGRPVGRLGRLRWLGSLRRMGWLGWLRRRRLRRLGMVDRRSPLPRSPLTQTYRPTGCLCLSTAAASACYRCRGCLSSVNSSLIQLLLLVITPYKIIENPDFFLAFSSLVLLDCKAGRQVRACIFPADSIQ